MTKALVPIDGSESALRALRHAMTFADAIDIVNVQPKADTPVLLLHMTANEIEQAQMANGRATIRDACRHLDTAGRAYRTHVLIGDPAAEIVRVAQSEGVDSIVMGTRGMGAWGNLVLGSTATKVAHLATTPVTLVK
jgi:nucleotide-binding universal stress UspA family protein